MAPTTTCPHCGQTVERAAFCTNCGQPLTTGEAPPQLLGHPPSEPAIHAEAPPPADGLRRGRREGRRFGVVASLLPQSRGVRLERYRWVAGVGLALVVILLLIGNAGLAIAVSGCIVPALFLMYFSDVDFNARGSKLALVATVAGGVLAGILIAIVNTWLVEQLWIKHATVNVGAAGFGGRFAEDAGFPPLSILALSGIVIPLVAEALQVVVPYELRRWTSVRNDVMGGITLGAAAGAGFAAAGTVAYYWPLIAHGTNPGGSVAGWTATLIGLVVVRPLLLGTITALLCAGIWRHALTRRSRSLVGPAGAGLLGAVIAAIGDLTVQPSGARLELLWLVVVLIVLGGVMRIVLGRALRQERPTFAVAESVVAPEPLVSADDEDGAAVPLGTVLGPAPQPAPEPGFAPAPSPDQPPAAVEDGGHGADEVAAATAPSANGQQAAEQDAEDQPTEIIGPPATPTA